MNLIQHGVPLNVVQTYVGYARLESTEVYPKIFALAEGNDVKSALKRFAKKTIQL